MKKTIEPCSKTLALFDFDGTLTTKDSLADFIQYSVGRLPYYRGLSLLSLTLIGYKLKLVSNSIAKQKLIAHFFEGWEESRFNNCADRYSDIQLNIIIRPEAMERVKWHQSEGHRVTVVSASMENWLKKWCQKYGLDLIATRLEVKNGRLTGKFSTQNCHGIEKVNRIKSRYDLRKYNAIYAYGDSPGDKEMLEIATKHYYKRFL